MENEETPATPKRNWRADSDALRHSRSQKFNDFHVRRTWSVVPTSKKGDTASTGGRSNIISARRRRGTVSARERGDTVPARERQDTVSRAAAEYPFGIHDDIWNVPSESSEGRDATHEESEHQVEARDALGPSPVSIMKWWERKAHLDDDLPLTSPFTLSSKDLHEEDIPEEDVPEENVPEENVPSEAEEEIARQVAIRKRHESIVKSRTPSPDVTVDRIWTDRGGSSKVEDGPDHDSELQSSESEQIDNSHDEDFQNPRLVNVPNERDNNQGQIEQMKRYAEEDYPPETHPEDRDSDRDSRLQSPHPGDALSDDERVVTKDSDSWIPTNEQKNDHDLLPKSPESDRGIDETSDRKNQAVSDMNQKPEETGTSSKTPHSSFSNERDTYDSQPKSSGSGPTLVDTSSIHDPVEGQSNPEISESKEAPDSPQSPGSDQIKSPDPQPDFPGSDQIKSPDSPPRYPEPGGVTVVASPTQDQVEENSDPKAWLKSNSPLPGNYKAIFPKKTPSTYPGSPRSVSSDSSSTSTSGTDSLIVPPARTDEQEDSEEENPSSSMANADFMNLLAGFKADSQLEPPSEEQEAKDERRAKTATDRQNGIFRGRNSERSSISSTGSEGSLIMPPGQDGNESPTNSEKAQEAKEEEESNQVALNLIELYSANFQLQKDAEEKEDKFKREIKKAREAPRPPPTNEEQRRDRLALRKIESKEMFDEFGEQLRPVKTDPQMVLHETQIDIMITRARLNYLLEDYPRMYMHANQAAAAASKLQFAPLTARCCYYRGMALYHHRDFVHAKDDFLVSRGCAGLFGISSESIEEHIDLIDKAGDPELAIIKRFPPRKAERTTTTTRSSNVENENQPGPSTADDASSLVGGSPTSPEDIALPLSPFSSPAEEERSAGKSREDAKSQTQTFRRPDPLGGSPLDGDSQAGTSTDDIPNYQPQEEAISEEIRKDIFESKAQSLNPVSEASPSEANPEERITFSPSSMASTEWTLLGSTTSHGTTRRVPRPHVAPITTSFAKEMNPVRQASPEATLVSGSTDEMDEDGIVGASGGARDDATPVSGSSDTIDEDEIMREFGAGKSGFIGAQGDDFTPVEIQRGIWSRNNRAR